MRRSPLLLLMLSSLQAHAISTVNIGSMNCSGSQTISIFETVSLGCSGDYSLSDGAIESDSKITITSGGSLSIDNVTFSAPIIDLWSTNNLILDSNLVLNAPGGAVTLSAGSDVMIGSTGGNIDAGRGTKTALTSAPPQIIAPLEFNSSVTLYSGSAIRANMMPNTSQGGTLLLAPIGIIATSEAGISGLAVNLSPVASALDPSQFIIGPSATVPLPAGITSLISGILLLTGLRKQSSR